jgi:UDP-N-acetyl-D-glucosamine dehydrogenase
VIPPLRRGHIGLDSVPLTAGVLQACDAAVIAANHDAFDYAAIGRDAPLVIDTRGVYREQRPNVVRA